MAHRIHNRLPPGVICDGDIHRFVIKVSDKASMTELTRWLAQNEHIGDYKIEFGSECCHYGFSDKETARKFKERWG